MADQSKADHLLSGADVESSYGAHAGGAQLPPDAADGLGKTGKLFSWGTLIRDHTRFLAMLPGYLAVYTVPGWVLPAQVIESVMVTMNTVNACPYCDGLHGQLARMAGVDEVDAALPAVVYATTFANESGRGYDVDASFGELVAEMGHKQAGSVQSLCWALLWGKTTGNSINHARNKFLKMQLTSITSLDIFMLVYYGPLFLVIALLNACLTMAPRVPSFASYIIGIILWLPQALFIAPLGIACAIWNRGIV